ncbi:MAG: hypothetical protein EP335_14975 [Alphaproteobacteria bacterium]|nr:MAG: hypothetical protein EP335_14975 [Alphaproteobacteria bacterium]
MARKDVYNMTRHIGFLFNHEAAHQISHMAPMIPALAASTLGTRISVLASSQEQLDLVRRITGDVPGCRFMLLDTPKLYAALDRILGKVAPFKRVATLKANLPIFEDIDALVVPERTSLMLRQRFGLKHLKFIRVCHGAGDRDVAWASNITDFDYVMLPGAKHRDRMLELGLVRPDNSAVIGYMKFDALADKGGKARLFDNDKPVVLYNPHFDPYLSSWYDMGPAILDYFAGNRDYNLVFAPHVMLMRRRLHTSLSQKVVRWRHDLDERFSHCPNILIDTGSPACMDMTYTRAADIYLGDVSSQVYEFIAEPRPCIFVNGHRANWRKDPKYRFWSLGSVVENIEELDRKLARCRQEQPFYVQQQQKLFRESIDLQARPSSERAAEALSHFLGLETCTPEPIRKSA